jgi:hypothetical protein
MIHPLREPGSASPLHQLITRLCDFFLLTILLWYFIPDQIVVAIPLVGGSRLVTFLLPATYVCLTMEFALTRASASVWFLSALIAVAYMTIIGLTGFPLYFQREVFGNDLLTFFALFAGLMWALMRSAQSILRAFQFAAAVSCAAVILTQAGLLAGLLSPAVEGDRLYTQSTFACAYTLAALAPFLLIVRQTEQNRVPVFRQLIWVCSIASLAVVSIISATRSVAFQTLAALILSLPSVLRQRKSGLRTSILVTVTIVGLLTGIGSGSSLLQQRAAETTPQEEVRYVEAQWLVQQLAPSVWTGWGFGSLYESPVVIDEYGLAAAPHVGLLAFLQKGGVFVFLVFVVAAFLKCVRGLLRSPATTPAYAASASMGVFFVTAAISGGWFSVCLFAYGVCIQLSGNRSALPRRSYTKSATYSVPGATKAVDYAR